MKLISAVAMAQHCDATVAIAVAKVTWANTALFSAFNKYRAIHLGPFSNLGLGATLD